MQVALDSLVYLILGVLSLGLLVMLAKAVSPSPTAVLDEQGLAEKALACYTHGECGTYRVEVKNATLVEHYLQLYRVPYRMEWEGGETAYVERRDGEVVIYG